mmetsp:Transcript_146787/g.471243  ORF Transcript_146787/g.471243 Transcript_146787/m.471243 type:complete len:388 (-) Transcript_146787:1028-2191(-)
MSFCKPKGCKAEYNASLAFLCPVTRLSNAETKAPMTRQGSPSESGSRGAEARTCSTRSSLQNALKVMSLGNCRTKPARCCNSSPNVMLPLSRCAKSGHTFVTGDSKSIVLPATVGREIAVNKQHSKTPTPASNSGSSDDEASGPSDRDCRPAVTRQSQLSGAAVDKTAIWAPKMAPASSNSCMVARTAASSSEQPAGAGMARVGFESEAINIGIARFRTTFEKGTTTSNVPQMFCNISKPRKKKSTSPGTLLKILPPPPISSIFPCARSKFSCFSLCLAICSMKCSCALLGMESRNIQPQLPMEASMNWLKPAESGCAFWSKTKPNSCKERRYKTRSWARTETTQRAAPARAAGSMRCTMPQSSRAALNLLGSLPSPPRDSAKTFPG